MKTLFFDLAAQLTAGLHANETLLLNFDGERSDFVRFNHGRVRQAMHIAQATLMLTLIRGARRERSSLSLTGRGEDDLSAARLGLAALRQSLDVLPDDPYLLFATEVQSTDVQRTGRLPTPEQIIDDVINAADRLDLVGIVSSGPIYRGFANSLGQRNWHAVDAAALDVSIYATADHTAAARAPAVRAPAVRSPTDKAVKCGWAGEHWSAAAIADCLHAAREQLPLLGRPVQAMSPGRYRAYLAPAAMEDLAGMLNWGGVSLREQRTHQSPLQKLVDGEVQLSPLVTVGEATGSGMAPGFDRVGFVRPAHVNLIEGGRHVGAMVSARSGREYGVPANGADEDETAESLSMRGGTLAEHDVLAALDTGLYVSNLHYLNWSDRRDARITGLTRFASFWVENGRIVAPLPVMRFDDSLYRLFGRELESLSAAPQWMLSTSTYDQRATSSMRLPGALLSGFTLTL